MSISFLQEHCNKWLQGMASRRCFTTYSKRHQRRIVSQATEADLHIAEDSSDEMENEAATSGMETDRNMQVQENLEPDILITGMSSNDEESSEDCSTDTESSSGDIENADIMDNEPQAGSLLTDLRNWAYEFRISHVAINALLSILLRHITNINLPRDARTLLRTPRTTRNDVISLCGGEYWHFGVLNALKIITSNYVQLGLKFDSINLLLNVDGLPISKSSTACFWPILISEDRLKYVAIVGCYYGHKKPNDANNFLQQVVHEINTVVNDGFSFQNLNVAVKLKGIVCDAPAKSFILNVKGHMGYSCCTKCTIRGKYIDNKICFPFEKTPSALRTNESFRRQTDPDFHNEGTESILTSIPNFDMVLSIPQDWMHLILLGITKKLILLWSSGPLSTRMSGNTIQNISNALLQQTCSAPTEFARKPRSLNDIKFWKATEFRQFLLYTGPAILTSIQHIRKDILLNFLSLHVAITILVTPHLSAMKDNISYAEELLMYFVKSFGIIYGENMMSYNIHNVLHLCDDVKNFGNLDEFSAFRFENFLHCLKSLLRKGDKPLQQLVLRYSEMNTIIKRVPLMKKKIILKKKHFNGCLTDDFKNLRLEQYKILQTNSYYINCTDRKNCYFLLKDRSLLKIENIAKLENEEIHIIGKQCTLIDDIYVTPRPSRDLDISKFVETNNLRSSGIENIKSKVWKMKIDDCNVAIPLCHSIT